MQSAAQAASRTPLLHGVVQRLKHRRLDEIIGVHNADVITAGIVQRLLSAAGGAAVGLVEHADAASCRASASQTSAEPSWLPSSASSSSKSVKVWARMLSTAGRR